MGLIISISQDQTTYIAHKTCWASNSPSCIQSVTEFCPFFFCRSLACLPTLNSNSYSYLDYSNNLSAICLKSSLFNPFFILCQNSLLKNTYLPNHIFINKIFNNSLFPDNQALFSFQGFSNPTLSNPLPITSRDKYGLCQLASSLAYTHTGTLCTTMKLLRQFLPAPTGCISNLYRAQLTYARYWFSFP